MSEVVSMRFDKSRASVVDFLAKKNGLPKSKAIRLIFDAGRVAIAVALYKDKKLSLEKAAQAAGLSSSEFMDELAARHIPSNISLEDFKESLKTVKSLAGK